MKEFFGYRTLDECKIKVAYYILSNKDDYGIQITKKSSDFLSSTVLNVSNNEDVATYFTAKCFQNLILPENLYEEIEKNKQD